MAALPSLEERVTTLERTVSGLVSSTPLSPPDVQEKMTHLHREIGQRRGEVADIHSELSDIQATLRTQTQILNQHTDGFIHQTKALREHAKMLHEQTMLLQEHTTRFDRQDEVLAQHARTLDEHTGMLKEILTKLDAR